MNRGRPDPKAQRRTFRAAESFYQVPQKPMGPIFEPEAPRKPRAPSAPSERPMERDVQSDIIQAVKKHPNVAWAGRFNRGQAVFHTADGKQRRVWFNTVPGLSDIGGQLKDGRTLWLEVKRDKYEKPTPDQAEFILKVQQNNGVAGCVHTVKQAMEILDND